MKHLPAKQRGYTLALLLVFIVIGIAITSTATLLILLNSKNASNFELGIQTVQLADSGAENAILRLLRNPAYTGETITTTDGTITITVTGSSTKIITSTARIGNFLRTIKVDLSSGNNLIIQSWKEIF